MANALARPKRPALTPPRWRRRAARPRARVRDAARAARRRPQRRRATPALPRGTVAPAKSTIAAHRRRARESVLRATTRAGETVRARRPEGLWRQAPIVVRDSPAGERPREHRAA